MIKYVYYYNIPNNKYIEVYQKIIIILIIYIVYTMYNILYKYLYNSQNT